jgi:hypothetical protein
MECGSWPNSAAWDLIDIGTAQPSIPSSSNFFQYVFETLQKRCYVSHSSISRLLRRILLDPSGIYYHSPDLSHSCEFQTDLEETGKSRFFLNRHKINVSGLHIRLNVLSEFPLTRYETKRKAKEVEFTTFSRPSSIAIFLATINSPIFSWIIS